MRKICIITGTRAEWGLLSQLAELLNNDPEVDLQIIATNMHLSAKYGYTYKEIEELGFKISAKVPMNLDEDSTKATVMAMGEAMQGFAKVYGELKPDLLVILGDRYEMLMAASAALIYQIPVAHIHGGELTEGAYDDAIRHSITKMSNIHFASTEEYRNRIIQLGEQPNTVFNVGAIGVDNINKIQLMDKTEFEESIGGFKIDRNTLLVTFHPVTTETQNAKEQIDTLLGALDDVKEARIIFTMPNSDTGSQIIAQSIEQWCTKNNTRAIWFTSLGLRRYLSALQFIGAVVGNSSSGIIEVPSFGIPTINIGDRQKGRTRAESVIDIEPDQNIITKNILHVIGKNPIFVSNPYHKENTAQIIYEHIKNIAPTMIKPFFDIKS